MFLLNKKEFTHHSVLSLQVFTNNKILPLPPAEEEGSGIIQEDVESETTSYTTLRSDADIVEQENAQSEPKQYGVSIIEILTKSSRLVWAQYIVRACFQIIPFCEQNLKN